MEGDSGERTTVDYFLFGLAAAGALTATWGVLLSSAGLALTGALVLAVPLLSFRRRR